MELVRLVIKCANGMIHVVVPTRLMASKKASAGVLFTLKGHFHILLYCGAILTTNTMCVSTTETAMGAVAVEFVPLGAYSVAVAPTLSVDMATDGPATLLRTP